MRCKIKIQIAKKKKEKRKRKRKRERERERERGKINSSEPVLLPVQRNKRIWVGRVLVKE